MGDALGGLEEEVLGPLRVMDLEGTGSARCRTSLVDRRVYEVVRQACGVA